jgi:hypothetical protein
MSNGLIQQGELVTEDHGVAAWCAKNDDTALATR